MEGIITNRIEKVGYAVVMPQHLIARTLSHLEGYLLFSDCRKDHSMGFFRYDVGQEIHVEFKPKIGGDNTRYLVEIDRPRNIVYFEGAELYD